MVNYGYNVDVSDHQGNNVGIYGQQSTTIKVSEWLNNDKYPNEKLVAQFNSAIGTKHSYFFAHFGSDINRAKSETNYALDFVVNRFAKGSWCFVDYEVGASNNKEANTQAILAAMALIKTAGYKPGLYSGAAYLRANINVDEIVAVYGNCIWVAAYIYKDARAVTIPDFNYFPSMNGVIAWQFTSNWKGTGVDASVIVIKGAYDIQAPKPAMPAQAFKVGQYVTVKAGQTKNGVGYNISGWVGQKIQVVKIRQSGTHWLYDGKVGSNPFNDLLESNIQIWEEPTPALFKVGDTVQISPKALKEYDGYDLTPRRYKVGTVAKVTKLPVKFSRSWYYYEVKYSDGTHNTTVLEQDLTF